MKQGSVSGFDNVIWNRVDICRHDRWSRNFFRIFSENKAKFRILHLFPLKIIILKSSYKWFKIDSTTSLLSQIHGQISYYVYII